MQEVSETSELPERLKRAYEHKVRSCPKIKATGGFLYEKGPSEDMLYFDSLELCHKLRVPRTGTVYFHSAERRSETVDIVLLEALLA